MKISCNNYFNIRIGPMYPNSENFVLLLQSLLTIFFQKTELTLTQTSLLLSLHDMTKHMLAQPLANSQNIECKKVEKASNKVFHQFLKIDYEVWTKNIKMNKQNRSRSKILLSCPKNFGSYLFHGSTASNKEFLKFFSYMIS